MLTQVQVFMDCCGKVICRGCTHAAEIRDDHLCPFCRALAPTTDEEMVEGYKKRMKSNDATAIYNIGSFYSEGQYGYNRDRLKALELWHRAGELGHAQSYYCIGYAYENGRGVERDEKKAIHYYELAAMRGDALARHNLGAFEEDASNVDRALKHYKIAIEGGSDMSLENIQALYSGGRATKDDYTNALRTYQAYLDDIKSVQRDEAAAFDLDYQYY